MNDALDELYQEIIVDHSRHPRHRGLPPAPTHRAEGFNPLCGDRVEVGLVLRGGKLEEAGFDGCGCAISQAAASLMMEHVQHMEASHVRALAARFQRMVKGEESADFDHDGELAAFGGVTRFPMRVKCATLPWHTLLAALDGKSEADLEEMEP